MKIEDKLTEFWLNIAISIQRIIKLVQDVYSMIRVQNVVVLRTYRQSGTNRIIRKEVIMSRVDDIRERLKNNMILFAKDRHDIQYLLDKLAKAERRAEAAEKDWILGCIATRNPQSCTNPYCARVEHNHNSLGSHCIYKNANRGCNPKWRGPQEDRNTHE